MRYTLLAILGVATLLLSESAFAFRCGQKLVRESMHEIEVRKICGNPATERNLGVKVRSVTLPNRRSFENGASIERFPGYGSVHEEVVVTEYVYNFGPRKFMRRLIFEGGVLTEIETLGYGYRESKTK